MLKRIPKLLSPQLLKVLCEIGHGDEIVLADGNFPSESMGANGVVVPCGRLPVPELLDAILTVLPLDSYVEKPVALMGVVPAIRANRTSGRPYKAILAKTGRTRSASSGWSALRFMSGQRRPMPSSQRGRSAFTPTFS